MTEKLFKCGSFSKILKTTCVVANVIDLGDLASHLSFLIMYPQELPITSALSLATLCAKDTAAIRLGCVHKTLTVASSMPSISICGILVDFPQPIDK